LHHNAIISDIQTKTQEILSKALSSHNKVALVDFPNHHNAGDSLIYLGEQEYLRRLGVTIGYVSDVARYDAAQLRRQVPHGPILIQGGGSLGDTWLEIQEFRERVISDFRDRRVIQLAQSVHFRSPDRAKLAREVFEAHPDFTVMVRESQSADTAARLFPNTNVLYCPDLAYGIGLQSSRLPSLTSVGLLRGDLEQNHDTTTLSSFLDYSSDWGWDGITKPLWNVLRVPGFVARTLPSLSQLLYPALEFEYNSIAKTNLAQAIRKLERGKIVVTDRLHAGILGALLQKTVILIDNNYGKLAAMYDDHLGKFPNVYYAGTPDQALELVRDLTETL
jgi:exopolysaccharide biosynthesis predicted pyruvyltransferase EpsI